MIVGTFIVFLGNFLLFLLGTIIGFMYLSAWILEEIAILDDNYIDSTLNVLLNEWYISIFAVDWVRVPIIFAEYQVTLFLGANEFNPNDERFQNLFMLLATPFLWQFMMFLLPYATAYMPIIFLLYSIDWSIFSHEVYIFEHDLEIDESDKWI